MPYVPLKLTHIRRKSLYDPKALVPLPPKNFPKIKRNEMVEDLSKTKRGINTLIETLTKRSMARIEKRYGPKGILTVRVMQALSLDKWAASYADHFVEGIKLKGALPTIAEGAGMKLQSPLPKQQDNPKLWIEIEKVVWEHGFDGFMKIFKRRFKDTEKIIRVRKQIDNFTSLPDIIYKERNAHWGRINKVVQKLLERKESPEKNLVEEIKRINSKHRTIQKADSRTAANLAAIDIVLAASIYADLKKAMHKEWRSIAESEEYWGEAYSKAMELTFPHIAKDPQLIRQILGFKKMKMLRRETKQLQLNLDDSAKK